MKGRKPFRTLAAGGSHDARRYAAVVLEALAGTVTPSTAAEALGISTPKYYVLESRALEGLIGACEPKPRGYAKTPEREFARLKKDYSQLERECVRYQALARAAQRALGVVLPKNEEKPEKGKRKRRPVVRALRAAEALKEDVTERGEEDVKATEGAGSGPGSLRVQRSEEKAGGDSGNDSREEGGKRGVSGTRDKRGGVSRDEGEGAAVSGGKA